jgi:hypothetical protein
VTWSARGSSPSRHLVRTPQQPALCRGGPAAFPTLLCSGPPVDDATGVQVGEAPRRIQRHPPPAVAPQQRRPQHRVAEQPPQVAARAVPAQSKYLNHEAGCHVMVNAANLMADSR